MKRAKNLFHKIYEFDNLLLAFYKASKGKRNLKNVLLFEENIDNNLFRIQRLIKSDSYEFNEYKFFKIYDPKERIISVAPFEIRLVHHAIMNVCHEVFEKQQIFHSYATRIGKGTHLAIKNTVKYNVANNWFLKLDVKKFFDTIDNDKLKQLLAKRFKEKQLLALFYKIIDGFGEEKGLPIGNLTSQYFANFYLSYLDRYAKEQLKIKHYIRYMDDIVVWGKTKKEIWFYYSNMRCFLEGFLLQTFKKPVFNKTLFPFNYLGYSIHGSDICPNKRNREKFSKVKAALERQLISEQISEMKACIKYWSMHQHYFYKINTYV